MSASVIDPASTLLEGDTFNALNAAQIPYVVLRGYDPIDELGALAGNFNAFAGRLREMVERIRHAASDIFSATDRIRQTSQEVSAGTVRQAASLEDSFQAIQGIDGSAIDVANGVSSLLEAVEISSSATLELGATIEEIVSQAERLFAIIEEISSSITQMTVTSQQVADKVGKCWGLGSDTLKDPGPWEGEQRNMWKPTQQEALWFHGGNLHQSRHYSIFLALQLKARMEGLETAVLAGLGFPDPYVADAEAGTK